jgi:hypothetical protein
VAAAQKPYPRVRRRDPLGLRLRAGRRHRQADGGRGARLFETTFVLPQLRLFALEEAGWLTAMKLEGYAPRQSRRPLPLQEVLLPYLDAL